MATKPHSRTILRAYRVSGQVLRQARALARSGRYASHEEIERELDRLAGSERAREWFRNPDLQKQLDQLCETARKALSG
jgi:hypothetical protein